MNLIGLYQVIVLALATSAISITISKGQIFAPTRKWIADCNVWLGELVSCFYCLSHWVAIVFVVIYRPVLISRWFLIDLGVSVFVIVAISALVSGLIINLLSSSNTESQGEINKDLQQLRSALEIARNKIVEQDRIIKTLRG